VERSSGAAPPRRWGESDFEKPVERDLLRVEIEQSGNGLSIVALAGELDLSTSPRLEGRLLEELHQYESVVVDLTRLTFIDSTGIGLLIKAHQTADGCAKLHTVVSEGSQVERVFELAGLGSCLPIFLDRDQAVAALGPRTRQGEPPG
jgi:anti-sigma B factor antagonist